VREARDSGMGPLRAALCYKDSDVEAEAEAEPPEAVDLWWKRKRKRLEICRFCFRSVSKLLFKLW
jgi:hypothetical protein